MGYYIIVYVLLPSLHFISLIKHTCTEVDPNLSALTVKHLRSTSITFKCTI